MSSLLPRQRGMVVRASSRICSRVRPGGYVNCTNSTIIGQSPCRFRHCIAKAAARAAKVLRCGRSIRYNGRGLEVKAAFTLLRDLGPMRMRMSIRDDFDAIERGAGKARPGAALILGGLLLLLAP